MVATLIRLLTGVQARWVGDGAQTLQTDGVRRVFFANHTSNLDGAVIWAALPRAIRDQTRPVAAQDYWNAGAIRRYLAKRVFNCVLIERKKVTRSSNPILVMQQAIDAGESLIIFPEGGRTKDETAEMGVFKPGLYHLAKKDPTVQLIPVYLENLNRILPKGEFILIPLLATARFGNAVELLADDTKESFLHRARKAVIDLKHSGDCHA